MKRFFTDKSYIKRTSIALSIVYGLVIILLALFNPLFKNIYQTSQWFDLSFILFITYLIVYIKDAFLMDYIEIVIEKEDKAFLPHLLEHTLEPFFLFLLFIGTTWIVLLFNTDFVLLRLLIVLITPFFYFQLKRSIVRRKSRK